MKFFKALFFCALFSLIFLLSGCCTEHVEVKDDAVAPTCTEAGLTEGSHCSKCDKVLKAQEEVPATGHTPVASKAIAPTYVATGLTEGSFCRVCNLVITAQQEVPTLDNSGVTRYASDDFYHELANFQKGAAMQEMYRDMNDKLMEFHLNTAMDAYVTHDSQANVASTVCYTQYGLTLNDARFVLMACKTDNPVYYWIENVFRYNDEYLYVRAEPEYAKGKDRAAANKILYDGLAKYTALTEGETSAYRIALAYHDAVLKDVKYAYTQSGASETAAWAHHILGVVEKGETVCEGYAEIFQALLNYSNVENLLVKGVAEGRHMWNLVKMDDGCWYWCDLTWDDTKTDGEIRHNFFCVNDMQYVDWYDRVGGRPSYSVGDSTFMSMHTPFDSSKTEPYDYMYELPKRSDHVFDAEAVLTLREKFTVDGCTYALIGDDAVQLIFAEARSVLDVPETVQHEGRSYTVTAAGGMNTQGYFDEYMTVTNSAQVTLPKTVISVSRNAFSGSSVTVR